MATMINSFLNVSRLDSGQMHIEKTSFDVQVLFSEIEDEVLSVIHSHSFDFRTSGSVYVSADRDKISQVIHNLIGNAVKYSPMGASVTVEYLITENNSLIIKVQDQGIGISAEDQQRIFERYYRVNDAQSSSIAGFGIGLYLCKEIIELHQGHIDVQSSQDEGSVFSFVLPLGEPVTCR